MGRAILTHARIVVLDEATASVDAHRTPDPETVRASWGRHGAEIAHRLDNVADWT
jgi:ABC-type multidrug transport system fused ATPase/permease subunit